MSTESANGTGATAQAPMTNPGRPWIRTTYQLAATTPATPETTGW